MGLDRTIRFATSETPSWEAILAELAPICDSVAIRMIDGLPAFPNEIPEPGWKELRIALAGGMVSIRRGSGSIACVIWGSGRPIASNGVGQSRLGLRSRRSGTNRIRGWNANFSRVCNCERFDRIVSVRPNVDLVMHLHFLLYPCPPICRYCPGGSPGG